MAQLEVAYSPDSLGDLEMLFIYVVQSSGYPRTAQSFTDRIRACCDRLGVFPESGKARPELGSNLRVMPFESVVIVYTAHSDQVLIARIFHGAQDYETLMRDMNS